MRPPIRDMEKLEAAFRTRARPVDLFRGSFPAQIAVVRETARLICCYCTRRAAKSYTAALKAFDICLKKRRNVLIAGLNRLEVKRIWWIDILKDIDARHELGASFNETELTVTFANGSRIILLGMDADEKQKKNALGQKYALIVIDEAQDWATDLQALIFDVFRPSTTDVSGTIMLIGTPGLVAKGLFYDVTTGKEQGWALHEWTTHDNTSQPDPDLPPMHIQWADEIAELKRLKPGVEKTAWFRRQYLRQWVVEEEALVYRYSSAQNCAAELPHFKRGRWTFGLGCDLGYNDATAFVVDAFHEYDPHLYFVFSHSQTGMDITAASNFVHELERRWNFTSYVVDGANKQAVEEMRKRKSIPWEAANKTGKMDFIEQMNADFQIGLIKLLPEAASLGLEYESHVIDVAKYKKTGIRIESPRSENHQCDAGLYRWRASFPYLAKGLPLESPKPGTPQWHEALAAKVAADEQAMERQELEELRQRQWQKEHDFDEYREVM